MKTVLGVTILVICLAGASALDCYSCSDCRLSGVLSLLENQAECDNPLGLFSPQCFKTVAGDGTVNRGCAVAAGCSLGSFISRCDSGDETNCIICCSTELCNSALNVKAAWLALGLSLVAAIMIPRF